MIWCAERLVEGVVSTSKALGVSAFLVSVLFVGFDPENLAVGAVGAAEEMPGIALGSVVGAAMVAVSLAFGVTALLAPMRFASAPKRILMLPVLAVLVLGGLAFDGLLSRTDGAILVVAFALAVLGLVRLSQQGLDILPAGETAEAIAHAKPPSRTRHAGSCCWRSLVSL
jgi:cation:H+ antiporter